MSKMADAEIVERNRKIEEENKLAYPAADYERVYDSEGKLVCLRAVATPSFVEKNSRRRAEIFALAGAIYPRGLSRLDLCEPGYSVKRYVAKEAVELHAAIEAALEKPVLDSTVSRDTIRRSRANGRGFSPMSPNDPPTVLFWELEQAIANKDAARAECARAALRCRGFDVQTHNPPKRKPAAPAVEAVTHTA